MIYIQIPASDKDIANQWVKDNLEPWSNNTFIVNKQDDFGNEYCLVSLPDDGSDYNNAMVEHFGVWDRIDAPTNGHNVVKIQDVQDDTILKLQDIV